MTQGPPDLPWSDDVEAADWIAPRLHTFGQDVGSVVPTGFEAYARLRHEPREGVIPEQRAAALARILAKHTSTPEGCQFCLWEGYGYLHPGGIAVLTARRQTGLTTRQMAGSWVRVWFEVLWRLLNPPAVPVPPPPPFPPPGRDPRLKVKLPRRDYLLYRGRVAQAVGWADGPNLWWPDDRAWCIASEIDLTSTFVAGTSELIGAIISNHAIDASSTTPDSGLNA